MRKKLQIAAVTALMFLLLAITSGCGWFGRWTGKQVQEAHETTSETGNEASTVSEEVVPPEMPDASDEEITNRTSEKSHTSSGTTEKDEDEADREWITTYIHNNIGNPSNPDFLRIDIERLDFACDNQGRKWAVAETWSYYRSIPEGALFEGYVFVKEAGSWWEFTAGSAGYNEGVPIEVQRQLGIEDV
ncbi:MAG: hypothetical protein KKB90_03910 [Actinobacteria bacterium]|nr:hypothetical protein [Actinomycetota bacterium]MCG2819276.1 hypothetical protein [Actinomycetes bacterium]MBU4218091.1 hypothetical protein [Actinomycetota bacterium]MBU4360207.1 hypothetical protein [Actinomycetota bacterium]MBU4393193.1 hypothetical protein [Actinomycetota bacterium]